MGSHILHIFSFHFFILRRIPHYASAQVNRSAVLLTSWFRCSRNYSKMILIVRWGWWRDFLPTSKVETRLHEYSNVNNMKKSVGNKDDVVGAHMNSMAKSRVWTFMFSSVVLRKIYHVITALLSIRSYDWRIYCIIIWSCWLVGDCALSISTALFGCCRRWHDFTCFEQAPFLMPLDLLAYLYD